MQLFLANLDNVIHVKVAGCCKHIFHRDTIKGQHPLIHELQQQSKRCGRDNLIIDENQITFVQPLFVEHMEEGAAGGQHGPVRQELGVAYQDCAVAEEALVSLLPQALQQLLAMVWELHGG